MSLVKCETAPARDELAISNSTEALAGFMLTDVLSNHIQHWEDNRDAVPALATIVLSWLARDTRDLDRLTSPQLWGSLEDFKQDMRQYSANTVTTLGFSAFLRTEELSSHTFNAAPGDGTADAGEDPKLLPVYFDIYSADNLMLHCSPEFMNIFPAARPGLVEGETQWYTNQSDLYVYAQRPVDPSSGTLEQHPMLAGNADFYGTYTTLTPHIAANPLAGQS